MIDKERLKNKIRQIADHYGLQHQCTKTIEELRELAEECMESACKDSITVNLINEIADVLVMILQLIYLGKIEFKDIESVMEYKVDRQLTRIANDKGEE